ncbi:MAG: hypothetical protein GXP25_13840, partial [Planctomycetes bacterium]|nr:hypothetical protein [Planctomycetota bacterium]
MKENVSENNIERLLKESYRPVEPSAEFEERLIGAMEREMEALPDPAQLSLHRWLHEIFALQMDRPRWWAAVAVADIAIIFLAFALFFQMIFRIAPEVKPTKREIAVAEPKEGSITIPYSLLPDYGASIAPMKPKGESVEEMLQVAAAGCRFEIRPASMVKISEWVAPTRPAGFDPSGAKMAGLFKRAPSRRPFDIGSVVDAVADEIKKELLAKREVVLVLMLDESRNLARDRRLIAEEVKSKIGELTARMSERQA